MALKKYSGTVQMREAEDTISPNTTIRVRSTLNARPFYEKNGYTYIDDAVSRAGFRIVLLEKRTDKRGEAKS